MILLPPRSTLFPYTTLFRSILCFFANFLITSTVPSVDSPSWMITSKLEYFCAKIDSKVSPIYETLLDRKSTRLNSSHSQISYAVFCLKKKKKNKKKKLIIQQ